LGAGGAEGAGTLGAGDGADTFTAAPGIRIAGPPTAIGAGAGAADTGAAAASFSAINVLVVSVLSLPQAGHFTGPGERPLIGSTSNLNFVPQGQRILISIAIASRWDVREGYRACVENKAKKVARFTCRPALVLLI
jgi:hypothetical protein